MEIDDRREIDALDRSLRACRRHFPLDSAVDWRARALSGCECYLAERRPRRVPNAARGTRCRADYSTSARPCGVVRVIAARTLLSELTTEGRTTCWKARARRAPIPSRGVRCAVAGDTPWECALRQHRKPASGG